MNRLLLFLCCICVPWMARGQAAYDWYYWFDMSHAAGKTGQAIGERFTIEADAQGLSEGFHTINMQVADTAGRFSPPHAQLFFHTADRTIKQLHYWFDNEAVSEHTVQALQNHLTIDVSSLEPGLHFIYCQVEDMAGHRSDITCRAFYRQTMRSVLKWSYWFDEDERTRTTMLYPGEVVMLDVSDLQEGFHVLHSQIFDISASDITTTMFIKIPQTENTGDMTCICTVDGKLVAKETVSPEGGMIKWNMNVDSLDVGIHKAMFQVITSTGAASSIAERYFVREITRKEMGSMKCVYAIDNFETYSQAGTLTNGLFHFDLNVASIDNGLHRIAYMLVSEEGVTTPQKTAFFWKTPLGGDGIVQYDYWVNDRDDQKHSVQLSERTNPFNLIQLLPVETQPIRSSNFQFAVKNDTPLIYARNDFHIQFFDINNRMVEDTKEYVDEQVSQDVEPVGGLQPTQTFERVPANDIRWYTMEAEEGDTVAFRISQAATVQLFAPSGNEVFKTSESASVNWAGIHTWEDGTYYLAVHDVTGSKENMTLDYMHMDKYDVVDWDVHTVGNGGCSTITFKGNGFRDLASVELYTAEGDTIHSVYVGHESDAETSVTFDFSDAPLGVYDAVFHFADEDKHLLEVVNVETAIDIELATNVSFPSTFLRGTSTTYTIKITNKGNMTSYRTPIDIYITSSTPNGISRVNISGLRLDGIFDGINMDSLSVSERNQLKTIAEEIGETHYFIQLTKFDEATGDSIYVMSNIFFTDIAPYSEKTITVTITTQNQVELWCSVPSANNPLSTDVLREFASTRRIISREEYCCIREKVECIAGVVADVAGFAKKLTSIAPGTLPDIAASIADCFASGLNTILKATGNVMCGNTSSFEASIWDQLKMIKDGISGISAIGKCAKNFLPAGQLKTFLDAIMTFSGSYFMMSLDLHLDGFNCLAAFAEKKPNCPPNPGGGGGSSTPQPPVDPNDIYGYLSEAGSKFIADTVARVNYTIEFENDTAFAQASAHTIVIKDTLDSQYFDRKTFVPTSVKIGERETFLDEAKDVKTVGGVTSFLKTIDMRPEINAIAQVEGNYVQSTGIATWSFTSLDPMTMEPTDDLMQGILPVNYDGTSGIGEVMFEIGVKPNKGDGAEVKNRASITFDYEEPILTPTWVNTVDAIAPEGHIQQVVMENDTVMTLKLTGTDNRSGVWRYNVYVQAGEDAPWWLAGENVTDSVFRYTGAKGVNYGFCVVATDSAGNVETKTLAREVTVNTITRGDANDDEVVNAIDAVLVINYYLGVPGTFLNFEAADVVKDDVIDAKDVVAIQQIYLNTSNTNNVKRRKYRKKP